MIPPKDLLSHDYQPDPITFKNCSTPVIWLFEDFKASLTSHRTCTYALVTEKNRLLSKGHLSYTCDLKQNFETLQ